MEEKIIGTISAVLSESNGQIVASLEKAYGDVDDVLQNGVSVVEGHIAKVTVPTKNSELENDSGFLNGDDKTELEAKITDETTRATTKENELEEEISKAGKIDDVKVNGTSVVKDKVAEVTVPTKMSQLEQDVELGKVDDVQVNGTSVVENKIAKVKVPTKTSELTNDSDFTTNAKLSAETTRATTKEGELEEAISKAGKIDDVRVNGSSVVTDKVAEITVPTKTSELTNDSNFEVDTNKTAILSEDSTATQYPNAQVTYTTIKAEETRASGVESGLDTKIATETNRAIGVETTLNEKISGLKDTYVCSSETNPALDSQESEITVSSLTDINGKVLDKDSVKIGDDILVKETDVPDRWVSNFDKSNSVFIDGQVFSSDGSLIEESLGCYCEEYINVTGCTSLTLTGIGSEKGNLICYDSNKKRIDYWGCRNRTISINCSYIRVSTSITSKDTIKIVDNNDNVVFDPASLIIYKLVLSILETAKQKVTDVTVNGTSVVNQTVAEVLLNENTIKLADEYKTYYSIGKVTASPSSPVTIGNVGDTLKTVLDNIMGLTRIQPTISSYPSVTGFTLSAPSGTSDEYGTEITTVNYSISTSAGAYSCDGKTQATGVTWSKYAISGGCADIDKTTASGTLTLSSTYVVGSSSSVAFNVTGTYGDGTIAKDNTGADSNPIVQIKGSTSTKSGSFSKSMVSYPYTATSSDTTIPTTGTKRATALESANGTSGIGVEAGKYVWVLSTTNTTTKKIQIYSDIAKSWGDMLGGTTAMGSVTFTMANGKTRTYYAYRTNNVSQGSDTATIRFN